MYTRVAQKTEHLYTTRTVKESENEQFQYNYIFFRVYGYMYRYIR